MEAVLDVSDIVVRFGGVVAVDRAGVQVSECQIVSLIGPNGAGKTTMFNAITGMVRPLSGSVRLDGVALDALSPHQRARRGLARTFQQGRLFRRLTLRENLHIACHRLGSAGVVRSALCSPAARAQRRRAAERTDEVIAAMNLEAVADVACADLPHGTQRLGEVARALCVPPRILLLDESAAGLDQHESAQLAATITSIRDELSLPVLLIEHDMSVVMSISDYVYVLDFGTPLAEGTPTQVRGNPAVVAAYLGDDEEEGLLV
jgi:branched-chain amino acid transport system ATP-binding protein